MKTFYELLEQAKDLLIVNQDVEMRHLLGILSADNQIGTGLSDEEIATYYAIVDDIYLHTDADVTDDLIFSLLYGMEAEGIGVNDLAEMSRDEQLQIYYDYEGN